MMGQDMRSAQAIPATGRSHASLWLVIVAGLAAGLFYPQFSLNHDSSWYLVATAKFLDGARLYVDIVEINPPLAFYLTIPPVAAARVLGVHPTTAYFAYVCALSLGSCLWTWRLLATAALTEAERNILLLGVAVALFVLPVTDFGQREHLMLILALPFLLSLILRPAMRDMGWRVQIALALTASLGLLLKPHFLLIPASVAMARAWQDRSLRPLFEPGMLALAAAAILYGLFVVLVHPTYLGVIVPVARTVYAAYGTSVGQVLAKPELMAVLLGAFAALRGLRFLAQPIAQLLASACIGAAAAYLIQFKGWSYHLLPLSAFVLTTAAWLWLQSARAISRDRFLVAGVAMLAILALGQQIGNGPYRSGMTKVFEPYIKAKGESILVLSADVSAAFPFVNEVSGQWASRFPAQWFIPGALNRLQSGICAEDAGKCAQEAEILEKARSSIVQDIERFRPDIIFVDERRDKLFFESRSFDYIQFLAQDPGFRVFEDCYRRVSTRAGHGVFVRSCTSGLTPSAPR